LLIDGTFARRINVLDRLFLWTCFSCRLPLMRFFVLLISARLRYALPVISLCRGRLLFALFVRGDELLLFQSLLVSLVWISNRFSFLLPFVGLVVCFSEPLFSACAREEMRCGVGHHWFRSRVISSQLQTSQWIRWSLFLFGKEFHTFTLHYQLLNYRVNRYQVHVSFIDKFLPSSLYRFTPFQAVWAQHYPALYDFIISHGLQVMVSSFHLFTTQDPPFS